MSLYSEFKAFIQRGNVIDLAVGVIMGGAFQKIVNSLVADVLMPPIGYVLGGKEFSQFKITLPETPIPDPLSPTGTTILAPVDVKLGAFIQVTFDFLIISFCVFAMIKFINTLKRTEPAPPPTPPEMTLSEKLLIEIRDSLKSPGLSTPAVPEKEI